MKISNFIIIGSLVVFLIVTHCITQDSLDKNKKFCEKGVQQVMNDSILSTYVWYKGNLIKYYEDNVTDIKTIKKRKIQADSLFNILENQ